MSARKRTGLPQLPQLPVWARVLLGAALAVAGAWCLLRPLLSVTCATWALAVGLAAVGIVQLVRLRGRALAWVAAGAGSALTVALIVSPGPIIGVLPRVALGGLAVGAATRFARSISEREGAPRITLRALWLLAAVIAALLALRWPDLAVLVAGWSFAVAMIAAGAWLALAPVWRSAKPRFRERPRLRAKLGAIARWGTAVVLVVLLAAGAAASVWLGSEDARPDAFYAWDDEIPEEPGTVLRVEPYRGEVPEHANAYRVLYATTHANGDPALASAVVVIPADGSKEERLVLAWQHGTTGVAQACAPSLGDIAVNDTAVPGIDGMIERGWVVVATDYPGQGTAGRYPYLIGEGEGRSTLDGIRAASALPDVQTSGDVLLWGHSQGGHATLWAADLAEGYAPELNVRAVAALSSASDPLALAEKIMGASTSLLGTVIASYVLVPYSDEYADISFQESVAPAAQTLVNEMADRCATSRTMLVSLLSAAVTGSDGELPVYRFDVRSGTVHERLRDNIAAADFTAPLFLGQGSTDEVIPRSLQERLAAERCAAGLPVEVNWYEGYSHMGVIDTASPLRADLFDWVDGVLAGVTREDASHCATDG